MSLYIGLDIGTTTITSVAIDIDTGNLTAVRTAPNDAGITSPSDAQSGRSEWDIDAMADTAMQVLTHLTADLRVDRVDAIGVTGQQHGMVLLDSDNNPVGPFIGWQDRRCDEPIENDTTCIDRMIDLGGDAFENSGCRAATGYMASTLFWLKQNDQLPDGAHACFAPDYIVSRLCGTDPVTDPTNAAASGAYDVFEHCWNRPLLDALNLNISCFPPVVESCRNASALANQTADAIGLPAATPVAVACGDNQASFAAAVANWRESVLINIGTGGQISAHNTAPEFRAPFELRPYLDGNYLLVGAGFAGGRACAILAEFFKQAAQLLGLDVPADDIYDILNDAAAPVPAGSDGLRCRPLFTGTRETPDARGSWTGITDANFTPGHLTRSLLEGLANQFLAMYDRMKPLGVSGRDTIVSSGNAVRNNDLLQQILSSSFDAPLRIPRYREEAAVGAALVAAVSNDAFDDIRAASETIVDYSI